MPRPKTTPLPTLAIADLKALLAENEIEVLKSRQAPAPKMARKTASVKSATATASPSIEPVVVDLLKANGVPMAVPKILATIKKQKLVKTKAASFDVVLRQAMSKSSRIKRVRRGMHRA